VQQIFLGKPMHNGSQEQVFSRVIYLDGKSKKQLKDKNFEVSVLNSINGTRVLNIGDSLQKKDTKVFTG
jgi:hypothetical protein